MNLKLLLSCNTICTFLFTITIEPYWNTEESPNKSMNFKTGRHLYQISVKFSLKYLIQFDHNDNFFLALWDKLVFWWNRLITEWCIPFFCKRRIEKKVRNNYAMPVVINLFFVINQIKIVTHFDFLSVLKLVTHSCWLHCQVSCNSAEIFFDPTAVMFHFCGS